ncbi:MAG: hypothetical protein IOD03_20820 [Methylocystis sp.]|nr:hypothetical protein [Methylocystis sp.]
MQTVIRAGRQAVTFLHCPGQLPDAAPQHPDAGILKKHEDLGEVLQLPAHSI